MKKILLVLVALTFISSISLAVEEGVKTAEIKTVIGEVVSVTVAEPVKGVAAGTIGISDEMGKLSTFTVDSSVTIVDETLNVLTLNQLKKGEKVEVKYSEKDSKAKSISVTK